MSQTEMMETQPNKIDKNPASPIRKKIPAWMVIVILIVLIAIGILSGYGSGMTRRYAAQDTLVTGQLQDQFQLGVQALNAGELEIAKQHFDFIIQTNPNFPGIKDAYASLLLKLQVSPTPFPSPTPDYSPTPDLRGVDEIYNNVLTMMSASGTDMCAIDWNGVITGLDTLRKDNPDYKTAQVDGLYYTAYRNRGICKIYPQSYEPDKYCQDLNINLEGGIYDLTVAERFGPLDSNAQALRNWARMYIAGASFWDQDWVQVKNYFSQVMAAFPNLTDGTCTSASERYRQASIEYAIQLANSGDDCGAVGQFEEAFTINSPKNADYYATATAVRNICAPPPPPTAKKPAASKTPVPGPSATP